MAGQASARSGSAKASTSGAASSAGRKRVTVKAGDSLSSIAKREGVSLAALKQANKGRAVLDRIYSGSKVVIPRKKK
jgi:LysM repeat protein